MKVSELNHLTEQIMGAAIEVHRHLGPGLSESAYQECLCRELALRGISLLLSALSLRSLRLCGFANWRSPVNRSDVALNRYYAGMTS